MSTTEIRLPVEDVSDTAYLVALYRAYESEQADAIFKDPLARLLVAPKAKWLEENIPFRESGRWFMAIRTKLLDDHIMNLIAEGADTIVNLAAGLDTRPYRLDLPKNLTWIEADFPGITNYKNEQLAKEKPNCQLLRIAVDLSNDFARKNFFVDTLKNSQKTVVITEGLLPYLKEEAIFKLAADLKSQQSVIAWLMDVTTAHFFNWFQHHLKSETKETDVSLRFAPHDWTSYYSHLGWTVKFFESFFDGSKKLNRMPPSDIVNYMKTQNISDDSGIALLIK